jgi:flagellin
MSVINTNITALIGQQNLGRSQSALQTSMERLSSGLRINSAKDDAAGQAIANRMSAQITGLMQAQRNANDGISAAQTAEGALNQINDNLQRIRELTVQASTGTNSDSDLDSIQNEIGQRLNEINRISEETTFNGVKVLAADDTLKIQVGAKDNETISVDLKKVTSGSLGVANFDVHSMVLSSQIDTDTSITEVALTTPYVPSVTPVAPDIQVDGDAAVAVNVKANGIDPTTLPQDSDVVADGIYQVVDAADLATGDYAVKGSDGNYYALTENTTTGKWTWDSSSTALTAASAGVAGVDTSAAVTTVETYQQVGDGSGATAADADITSLEALTVATVADFFGATADDVQLHRRNDVEVGYAVAGADGKFYAVDVASDGTVTIAGGVDPTTDPDQLVEVSAANVDPVALTNADNLVTGSTAVPSIEDNLYNVELTDIPTADGLYALADGTGYAVKGSDGNYYAGTEDTTTGDVEWDSSSAALDPADVDTATAVTEFNTELTEDGLYAKDDGTGYVVKGSDGKYYEATVESDGDVTWASDSATEVLATDVDESAEVLNLAIPSTTITESTVAGLATGETLHAYTDADGNEGYVVKGTDANGKTTYTTATLSAPVNSGNTSTVTVTKDADGELTVNALDTVDVALKSVDALRSDLGAIQNRLESAITNLGTTATNLSAARSRIQDADYAVEVSNLTRAQILQQAGTSVLAQANQVPQTVLSLLR